MRTSSTILLTLFAALIAFAVSAPLLGAQGAASVQSANPRDIQLRIETSRSTYRVGDSVAVRLAFSNEGAALVDFITLPPWAEARLVLTDGAGRVVPATLQPAPLYLVSTHREKLSSGESQVRGWENQQWFSLRMWGYAPLAPGGYTIQGAPLPVLPGVPPDSTLRSNRVTITVSP